MPVYALSSNTLTHRGPQSRIRANGVFWGRGRSVEWPWKEQIKGRGSLDLLWQMCTGVVLRCITIYNRVFLFSLKDPNQLLVSSSRNCHKLLPHVYILQSIVYIYIHAHTYTYKNTRAHTQINIFIYICTHKCTHKM